MAPALAINQIGINGLDHITTLRRKADVLAVVVGDIIGDLARVFTFGMERTHIPCTTRSSSIRLGCDRDVVIYIFAGLLIVRVTVQHDLNCNVVRCRCHIVFPLSGVRYITRDERKLLIRFICGVSIAPANKGIALTLRSSLECRGCTSRSQVIGCPIRKHIFSYAICISHTIQINGRISNRALLKSNLCSGLSAVKGQRDIAICMHCSGSSIVGFRLDGKRNLFFSPSDIADSPGQSAIVFAKTFASRTKIKRLGVDYIGHLCVLASVNQRRNGLFNLF